MLGWKCSRVPAGGCERRVPAGERSDPAGSSSAQPGLAEAEGQERCRLGRERGEGEVGRMRQQRQAVADRRNYSRDCETTEEGDREKLWSWIKVGYGRSSKITSEGHCYLATEHDLELLIMSLDSAICTLFYMHLKFCIKK